MAIALLYLAPVLALRSGLRLNGSPSMPMGLYWLHEGVFPAARSDIVFACPDERAAAYLRAWDPEDAVDGSCPGNMKPLVKIAAGLPGDRVSLSRDGVRVNNGPLLPNSAPQAEARANGKEHPIPGIPLRVYVVPTGRVWLYAPKSYSFDSRYYGPLPVIGVGVPVFVHSI